MLLLLFSATTALLTAATLLPLWRWQHWLIRSFDFPRLQFALTLVAVLILELLLLDWSEVSTQILIGIGFACLLYQIWWIIRYSPDRKSTRLNSSHVAISYAVFCLKKKIT